MSEIIQLKYLTASEVSKEMYNHFKLNKFSKICQTLELFLIQLDSSISTYYKSEEMDFISETLNKSCHKMLKTKKINTRLLTLTLEFSKRFSNCSRLVCESEINFIEGQIADSRYSDAKKKIKVIIKNSSSCNDCNDLTPKLYNLLGSVYLKIRGKHQKSLKASQKALDLCYRKINSPYEVRYSKYVIEALFNTGMYYIKIMDFTQAEIILQKAYEFTTNKKICNHLIEKLKKLSRDISKNGRSTYLIRNRSKNFKSSGSFDDAAHELFKFRSSQTALFNKSFDENLRGEYQKSVEYAAAVRIQSYFKMHIQRKKYLQVINRKLLKFIKRKIDNVDYMISAILNKDKDVIIEATPLTSKIVQPKSYVIKKNQHKEYGIENLNYVSNLLGWVNVINNRVFVSHKLNKKRLVFKGSSDLKSSYDFQVKIFETDDEVLVQASNDSIYEIVITKEQFKNDEVILPQVVLAKIKFEYDKIVYLG